MVSESPNVVERSVRPTIPVQEGTFLLYPENQKFLQGESKQLTAINLGSRYVLAELGFLYLTLFLFIAVFLPLGTMDLNLGPYGFVIASLVLVPLIVWIGYLIEKQINRYVNQRIANRYQREGHLLSGVLESCTRAPLWSFERSKLIFAYTFTTPTGESIRGHLAERNRTFGRRPIPEAGTPVVVLYFGNGDHYLL